MQINCVDKIVFEENLLPSCLFLEFFIQMMVDSLRMIPSWTLFLLMTVTVVLPEPHPQLQIGLIRFHPLRRNVGHTKQYHPRRRHYSPHLHFHQKRKLKPLEQRQVVQLSSSGLGPYICGYMV